MYSNHVSAEPSKSIGDPAEQGDVCWQRATLKRIQRLRGMKQCSIRSQSNERKKKVTKIIKQPDVILSYIKKGKLYAQEGISPGLWVREFSHGCCRLLPNIILLANFPNAPLKSIRVFVLPAPVIKSQGIAGR